MIQKRKKSDDVLKADDLKAERQKYYQSDSFIGIVNPALHIDDKTISLVHRSTSKTYKEVTLTGTVNPHIIQQKLSDWSEKELSITPNNLNATFVPFSDDDTVTTGQLTLKYGALFTDPFPLNNFKIFYVISGGIQIRLDAEDEHEHIQCGISLGEQFTIPPQKSYSIWNDPPNASAKIYCVVFK